MGIESFSFIGTLIFIMVVVLIVLAIRKIIHSRKEMKQENERLRKELSDLKNN